MVADVLLYILKIFRDMRPRHTPTDDACLSLPACSLAHVCSSRKTGCTYNFRPQDRTDNSELAGITGAVW